MKLFYYQRNDGLTNFGDLLNSWLWNQLLSGVFDEDETITFVGIGTLLNNKLPQRIPKAKKVIIFSTGAGYEKNLTFIPEHYHIYCVRGFLSAKNLGISEKLGLTDGAVLIRRLFKPESPKIYRFSFMPHVHHAKFAGKVWEKVCGEIGFQYIDPCWPLEKVLSAISKTEILLAEAMHGAITADALRIPWIPVITSPRILTFKWQDWCSSIGLTYQPRYLIPLDIYPPYGRGVRSSLRAMQNWWYLVQQGGLVNLRSKKEELGKKQLIQISKNTKPYLSSDQKIEQLTVALEDRLELLKQDLKLGKIENN